MKPSIYQALFSMGYITGRLRDIEHSASSEIERHLSILTWFFTNLTNSDEEKETEASNGEKGTK